jgi:hypothetical protein
VLHQNEDAKLPLFDGSIAGVHISSSEDSGRLCDGNAGTYGDYSATIGTPLTLQTTAAIAGIGKHEQGSVLLCDGRAVAAGTHYTVAPDLALPRFGGSIEVYRHTGKAVASLAIPAARWREGTIAGHAAAIASPILPDLGLGEGAVVLVVDGVTTVVHSDGVPLADLIAFAEGLYR